MVLRRLIVAVCVVASFVSVTRSAETKRPNIIVIVADDQGYSDLGVQGGKDIPTPHIDSLAKYGVRCTSGYVSGPYCSPTRAGLITGRYQQRFGHEFNPGPAQTTPPEVGLSLNEVTLPQRLKDAGYATGMVGKWHLGYSPQFHPLKRGFEEFFGFLGGGHSYTRWAGDAENPILRNHEPVTEETYLTDAFGREATAYIERHANKDKPFFLYWTFNAVHTPMEPHPKYAERFASISDANRRTYATMTAAMDDAVGLALAKLRDLSLEQNTLIFYVSDNGGPPVNASSNAPLRGHKAQTLEGGIRVPYFVQWKGTLPAGKTYDQPVIQLDMHATALAAAGVPITAGMKLDGVNLLPYLMGDNASAPHDALYWRFGPQTAIRMGDWKLVKHNDGTALELYNLKDDIGESKDLAAANPQKFGELKSTWDKWNAQLVEPKWGAPSARINGTAKKNKKNKTE